MRAVVSSTASGDTGAVGNTDAPGTAVGGANRAKPTGSSSTTAICPAEPQVSMTPESQISFSNSASPESAAVRAAAPSSSQATQLRQHFGINPIVDIDSG